MVIRYVLGRYGHYGGHISKLNPYLFEGFFNSLIIFSIFFKIKYHLFQAGYWCISHNWAEKANTIKKLGIF